MTGFVVLYLTAAMWCAPLITYASRHNAERYRRRPVHTAAAFAVAMLIAPVVVTAAVACRATARLGWHAPTRIALRVLP